MSKVSSDSPAEIRGIMRKVSSSGAAPARVAPMPRPMQKASPKAAPSRPMYLARFSGLEMSAA